MNIRLSAGKTQPAQVIICFCLALSACQVEATDFLLPPYGVDLIGSIRFVHAKAGETLFDIARNNDVGADEIEAANPTVDPWIPKEGTMVKLPTQYILPRVPREGIVVNSREMRLYFYPPATLNQPRRVVTHPVSVGRTDWGTPVGMTKIREKLVDPVWIPPESIRKAAILEGDPLPAIVPAGPDNPLGKYAMRLALPGSYLIHGTDKRKEMGIGMQVTHGCMRLYTEDIASLFKQVAVDTKVNLIYEPVKLGWLADTLYIEVIPPPQAQDEQVKDDPVKLQEDLLNVAKNKIYAEQEHRPFVLVGSKLREAVEQHTGIPIPISRIDSDIPN